MAAIDYIDPKGYWIDPEGNIRRMGNEDGEQEIIASNQRHPDSGRHFGRAARTHRRADGWFRLHHKKRNTVER